MSEPRATLIGRSGRPPRAPRRSIRVRLTVLYGALFMVSGTVTLALTYALNATSPPPSVGDDVLRQLAPNPALKQALISAQETLDTQQRAAAMRQLLLSGVTALGITALFSVMAGWLIANRVLRPLRTMTVAASSIDDSNLHLRLALTGPDDELTRLGAAIDSLLARLERAFDAQRRFIANASHELRTPLTMMRAAVDVAESAPTPPAPAVTVLAARIRLALDRADGLVESFLTLARAQHGAPLHPALVELDRLASVSVAEHIAAINAMNLTVEQDHRSAPTIGSESLLMDLIDNLIGNAVRHNQPGGWIRVTTAGHTSTTQLIVENSGSLLDPRRVHALTEPFRRVAPDRTTADHDGAGLGLSIAAAIVSTHGGTLGLYARPSGGLRVTATLPRAGQGAITTATTA